MVPFSGWNMPVQYTNVIDEHNTTRKKAGLFDISHMGEFKIKGRSAKKFLQQMTVNDLDKLQPGTAQYSVMCYEDGGVVDDLFIYMIDENDYMLVVNAGTIRKDFSWLKKHIINSVNLKNISDRTGKMDLQGPLSEKILQKICKTGLSTLKRFHFIRTKIDDIKVMVSRTGYTGEDGFEIYCDVNDAVDLWNLILDTGKKDGIKPVGLGARDTLRLEACYSLYGHEISKTISPIEGSIGWVVRIYKDDFIGKDALRKQKEKGTKRINIAFEMTDRAIAREHYRVERDGKKIGEVTSGTFSPTFKKPIGLALVKTKHSHPNTEINIIIRGRVHRAKVVKKPFYEYGQGEKHEKGS